MAQPTGGDFAVEVYIKSKFARMFGKGTRQTLSQAIAAYLQAIEFPIDVPDRQEEDPEYGISDYIPAKIGQNLFYWLTTNEISSDDNYQKSVVAFVPDGTPTAYPGSRLQKSGLPGLVRVFVDSAPAGRAMDVALRLWDLFSEDIGFQARRKRYDGESGLLIDCDEPDLVVHRCFPRDEPQIIEKLDSGLYRATFGLIVHFSRVK